MSFDTLKPRKIRIVEPGWENYTGWFGIVEFENAVSKQQVSTQEQARLGAILRMESAEEGEENEQVSQAADLLRYKEVKADEPEVVAVGTLVNTGEETVPATELKVYTKEELEVLADKRGINGLRDIGKALGVSATSINSLIEKILKAQEKPTTEE